MNQINNVVRLLYRAPYCNVLMMARFNGNISKDSLEAALSIARLKYPMLNAKILQDDKGNIEYAFDYNQKFIINFYDNKSDADWLELAWNEQKIPFNFQNDLLIKFLLICKSETTDLVVICHHCICDGLSLTYLIKDIALFIDNPDKEVQQLSMPPEISKENLSVDYTMGFSGFITKILAKSLNRSWNKSKVVFTEKDYENLYNEYWKTKNIGLMTFSLTKDITAALIDKCHSERMSVNSALTTAFSLSQYELQGNRQLYLRKALLAINIRHLFKNPQQDNFGFLAVGNEITLPFGKDGFWNIAGRFNSDMKEMLANPNKIFEIIAPIDYIEPTLLDAIYFVENGTLKNKAAVRFKNIVLSKTGKPKRSLDITNIGTVKDCSSNLQTLFFIPILSGNYEKTIGIVTINGEMNIVVMHDHAVINKDIIEKLRQCIISIITEAIQQ